MKQRISVVITDLDNTLFDWVDFWYKSFSAMLDRLVLDSGIPRETLLPEFKAIHERHRTSEYAFSIEELPSLRAKYPGEDLATRFEEAIHAYRSARKSALRLFPTVAETFEILKDRGCLLVGYTESMSFYSRYRVRNLGLDRVLDYLYSPPDHDLPGGLRPEQIRRYASEHYQLRRTTHRHISEGELKPNPKVLSDIVRDVGASPSETMYVGDSLMKDMRMAQRAGVTDVWAKYGQAHAREEYDLLRSVTHWTDADVEREKKLTAEQVNPTYVLANSFDEVLGLVEFDAFLDRTKDRMALIADLWKKTVDVQQHFNDIELRIRNYALTVLAAILGFAAYAVKENLRVPMFGREFSVAAALLACSVFLWLAFYFMDRGWYHRLLYGAVDHGRFIENRWKTLLPEIALTDSIGRHSPLKIGSFELHSPRKIDLFYLVGLVFLVLLIFLAQFGVRPSTSNPPTRQGPTQHSPELRKSNPAPLSEGAKPTDPKP